MRLVPSFVDSHPPAQNAVQSHDMLFASRIGVYLFQITENSRSIAKTKDVDEVGALNPSEPAKRLGEFPSAI